MASADSLQLWSLSDGRAGNARQANALSVAMGLGTPREWQLQVRAPWRWLAPRLLPASDRAFGNEFASALAQPPALAIGCGRQAALATRLLGARTLRQAQGAPAPPSAVSGNGHTRTVQILDPRIDPAHWDLVVVPQHDRLRGANVIATLGSLHPVDDVWLARARDAFAPFADLPRPRTAVLLGGSSAHVRFDRGSFETLATTLDAAFARDAGSILLTTSRRTPQALREALRDRYDRTPGVVWRGDDDGANPYAGMLAWADRIVCSPDSVNMISEACATHAPVFVFAPASVRGRPRQFLDTLLARGRIRAMDAVLAPFDVEPLRETARVADVVRARLGL